MIDIILYDGGPLSNLVIHNNDNKISKTIINEDIVNKFTKDFKKSSLLQYFSNEDGISDWYVNFVGILNLKIKREN